jgi:Icc-related predicted phosphoesterase
MRINLVSDLHLEFGDLVLPGGDVLILGGDICEAKHLKMSEYQPDLVILPLENPTKRHDRYARFFVEECAKYRQVIYVMGNHEHYNFTYDDTYDYLKSQLPANVTLLENQTVEIDDIVFIGATLWTDCNQQNPLTIYDVKQCMNDYRVIKKKASPNHNFYGKLTPEFTISAHKTSRAFIREQLKLHGDRRCVVVTHHAPSQNSICDEYKHDFHMNGAYFSSLEDLILDNPNCVLWTHGHVHNYNNYKLGNTTVLSNPRGYNNYERRANEFDPDVGIDL